MCDQLRNPAQLFEMAYYLRQGRGTINPDMTDPERAALLLAADERQRLAQARMWSISGELGEVAARAGRKLPSWNTRRGDPPSPSGLIVYDEPIAQYVNIVTDPRDCPQTVSIVAASWGPSDVVRYKTDQLWLTFWAVVDHELLAERHRDQHGLSARAAREAAYQQKMADLNWDNEALLTYDSNKVFIAGSDEPRDPSEGNWAATTTTGWVQTIRSTWALLKPSSAKIVETEEVPLSRTVRRQTERAGMNADAVTVVRLHSSRRRTVRRDPAGEPSREGGKLSVRFPVSGHIRWQPFPSRGVIEAIWIDPFDKGPEGAPYRVGKNFTVYRLDQLPPPD